MRICKSAITILLVIVVVFSKAQTYNPIAITGLDNDVVAESGTSSLTTTTIQMDGASSNKVMYTNTFRTTNGFGGGGLPDNGTYTFTGGTFQMAPYTGNNAVLIPRNVNKDITLATPAKYSALRLLALSTEGASLVNITLFFTDGTQSTVVTNGALSDWFNGTTNVILQGFGRCNRVTPVNAGSADAFPTNPRLYFINVPISCANKDKSIQKINVANVTTAGTNAPFPNVIVFAASGITHISTTASVASTNATCTALGSATLTVSGSSSPFTISWNTVPVQTGVTATNLSAGTYIATITDAAGCVTTQSVTISQTNNLTLTNQNNVAICSGNSFTPTFSSNANNYAWTPTTSVSNPATLNPTLAPTTTTPYTLTATLGTCTQTRTFTIDVTTPTMSNQNDVTICSGGSFTPTFTTNTTNYSWTPTTGVSNPSILNPILNPTINTPYTITGTLNNCPISRTFRVNVLQGVIVDAGQDVFILEGSSTQLRGSGSTGTYLWTSVPASGNLSATNTLDPIAKPATTTTYTLRITTPNGCTNTDDVIVNIVPYCVKPLNIFSPNGDGINDKWVVTSGNCVTNVTAIVYNRYGNLVFESKNYTNNWDGTYKGKALPDGTYYYSLSYALITGTVVQTKGDVTILR